MYLFSLIRHVHFHTGFTDETGAQQVEIVSPNQARGTGETFAYTYDIRHHNQYLTLQSLSTEASQERGEVTKRFLDYYEMPDFGDQWILAAASRVSTNFVRGGGDFRNQPKIVVAEAMIVGILMLNVLVTIMQGIEQVSAKCQTVCTGLLCNEEAVSLLDRSVALYCGSGQGESAPGEGVFQYALSERRSGEFGVDKSGDTTNDKIMSIFEDFQNSLLTGDCSSIPKYTQGVLSLLKVPLVQSVLRFAYLRDHVLVLGVDDLPKAEAFGASYAAAIVPLVHACNRADANIIYENLRIGSKTSSVSFRRVKEALEKNYECMALSCKEIGGIWTEDGFVEDGFPCTGNDAAIGSRGVSGYFVISALSMALVVIVAVFYTQRVRRRRVRGPHSRSPSNIAAVSTIT
jgi:hypothetical protein